MKQLKIILLISISLSFTTACSQFRKTDKEALIEFFGSHPDSLSLEEIELQILDNLMDYAFRAAFSKMSVDDEIQSFKKEDESYKPPYSLSPRLDEMDFRNGISFNQYASYPSSELKMDSDVKEGETNNVSYFLDWIYYHDNTSDTSDIKISSRTSVAFKKIDSVKVLVRYSYPLNFEKVELSLAEKTMKYNDGEITIQKMQDNYVEYFMSDKIWGPFLESQAVNGDGKILNRNSMSASSYLPKKASKIYEDAAKSLKPIAEKINQNEYTDKERLIADVYSQLHSSEVLKGTKNYYRSEYYYGNIKKLYLYFSQQWETEEYFITFPVVSDISSVNEVVDRETDKIILVDSIGNKLLELPENIEQLSSYYYLQEDEDGNEQLLLLNTNTLQFDTLHQCNDEDIEILTDELILLTHQGKNSVLNRYGKTIISPTSLDIEFDEQSELLVAFSDESVSLYDTSGRLLFSGNGRIDYYSEGLAIYWDKAGNLLAFIDEKGKQVIPMQQYNHAMPFSDGLSIVKKGEKYGCIRKDGSVAIPFIYKMIRDFSYGVTLVSTGDEFGIIDVNNNFVVPLEKSNGYSVSSSFGKRTYRFGGNSYNEKGKLIVDE